MRGRCKSLQHARYLFSEKTLQVKTAPRTTITIRRDDTVPALSLHLISTAVKGPAMCSPLLPSPKLKTIYLANRSLKNLKITVLFHFVLLSRAVASMFILLSLLLLQWCFFEVHLTVSHTQAQQLELWKELQSMTHGKGGKTESDGAHPELQHSAKCESYTGSMVACCTLLIANSTFNMGGVLKEVQSITKDKITLSLTLKFTDKVLFVRLWRRDSFHIISVVREASVQCKAGSISWWWWIPRYSPEIRWMTLSLEPFLYLYYWWTIDN